MESEELLILKRLAQGNRINREQNAINADEAQQEAAQSTIYTGIDPVSGLARLQSSTGDIFYGSAQTNGAVGIGDTIRLRGGGAIARYDAMPTSRKELQKDSKVLQTQIVGFYSNIVSVSPTNPEYAFSGGLVSGNINGGLITLTRKIENYSINFLVKYGWNLRNTYSNRFPIFGYYSMGWLDKKLIFVMPGNWINPFINTSADISNIRILVYSLNPQSKTLTYYSLELKTTSINLVASNQIFTTWYVYYLDIHQVCIKYKSLDGTTQYTVISGTNNGGNGYDLLFIWHLGKLGEFKSKDNFASFLGFYKVRNNLSSIRSEWGNYGGYGAEGGIVLRCAQRIGIRFDVFVPEKYLVGQAGQMIDIDDLIFSERPTGYPYDQPEFQSITIGSMPDPLDKREEIYQKPTQVRAGTKIENTGTKKLAFWTIPNKDQNKQIFS